MCVFWSFTATHLVTSSAPGSPRTAMSAPNSTERKTCWNSRDQLWKCLDDNGDKAECCQKYQSEFEANCPAQWVNSPVQQSTQAVIQTNTKGGGGKTSASIGRGIQRLITASVFPSRSSILQRGETSWNTKRRWRQKVSHLLKAPSSLPNTRAADHLDFQSDRPLNSHQVQRCRTVKNSPNVVSLEFAIVVIYSYKLQAIQIAEGMLIYLTRCLLGTWLKMQNHSEDLRRSRN